MKFLTCFHVYATGESIWDIVVLLDLMYQSVGLAPFKCYADDIQTANVKKILLKTLR